MSLKSNFSFSQSFCNEQRWTYDQPHCKAEEMDWFVSGFREHPCLLGVVCWMALNPLPPS